MTSCAIPFSSILNHWPSGIPKAAPKIGREQARLVLRPEIRNRMEVTIERRARQALEGCPGAKYAWRPRQRGIPAAQRAEDCPAQREGHMPPQTVLVVIESV